MLSPDYTCKRRYILILIFFSNPDDVCMNAAPDELYFVCVCHWYVASVQRVAHSELIPIQKVDC